MFITPLYVEMFRGLEYQTTSSFPLAMQSKSTAGNMEWQEN